MLDNHCFHQKCSSHDINAESLLIYIYCEIIINRGVPISADFVVHLNHENKNPTKCNFPIDCCL